MRKYGGKRTLILYLVVVLWPLIMHEIYKHHRLKFRKACSKELHVLLAMLPMFIMIGFRSAEMGADTSTYLTHFVNSINTPLEQAVANTRMETGYIIFVKLIGAYVTKNPLIYQLICTLIYFIGVFSFAKQQEADDAFLFIYFLGTLGLFTFMFTGVRQCIAMSICLYAYQFAKKKELVKFLICVLIAFSFHKSALLFVVVFFVVRRKITFYNIALYGLLAYISTLYLDSIQIWFNEQLEYDYAIEETGNGGVFLIVIILLTVFSAFCIYQQKCLNEHARALLNVNFITIFFWILRMWTRVAERPSYYFLFFTCALVSFGLNRNVNGRPRVLFKIAIIVCTLFLYYYRMKTNFVTLIPYQFY